MGNCLPEGGTKAGGVTNLHGYMSYRVTSVTSVTSGRPGKPLCNHVTLVTHVTYLRRSLVQESPGPAALAESVCSGFPAMVSPPERQGAAQPVAVVAVR